jgi:hypothetical protein
MAASMTTSVFWDVEPYSLVESDRHFEGVYHLDHQEALMTEAVSTYEILVNFYETVW